MDPLLLPLRSCANRVLLCSAGWPHRRRRIRGVCAPHSFVWEVDRIQTGERWDPGCSVNTVSEGRVMGAFDLDAENVLEVKLILAEANHEF